jgi:hypothetical protein
VYVRNSHNLCGVTRSVHMVLQNWVLAYVGYKLRTGRSGPKQFRRGETDWRPDVLLAQALRQLCKEFPQNIALNRTFSTRC